MKNLSPSQDQLKRLFTLYKNGQLSDAENLAISYTNEYPKHQFAWKVLAAIFDKFGKNQESLLASQKAVELNPNDPEAYNNLGNILTKLGQLDEAITRYNQAITLKSNYPEAFYNLANAQRNSGLFVESKENFNKAIVLNPNYFKAYMNLGFLHTLTKDFDKAVDTYNKAIELNPNYAEAYNNLGNAFKELGQLDKAVDTYNKAIDKKNDFAPAYNNLGTTLEKLGKFEEAEINYRKAIVLKPDGAEAYNNLGLTLRTMGRLDESKENYIKAIELNPDYANAHYNLSMMKKFKTKDEQFKKMLNLSFNKVILKKDQSLINFSLAKAYEDLQEFDKSFLHYVKGNDIRKEILNYQFKDDKILFDQIKKNSNLIFQNSLNLEEVEKSITPIFIVGMPRSGTTLVEQIVSSHSDVTGAGEILFMSQLSEKITKGLVKINKTSLLDLRKNYLNKLKNVSNGKLIVIDKLPHNFRYIGIICSALPEAKIIHTQREPAAVCWANFKQYFSNSGLGYSYSLENIVNYYQLYLDLMKHWRENLNKRIFDLDYELLVENQENETRKLINYLNLIWDPKCLSPQDNKKNVTTASSAQVRKKIYGGSSKQWINFKPYLKGAFDEIITN